MFQFQEAEPELGIVKQVVGGGNLLKKPWWKAGKTTRLGKAVWRGNTGVGPPPRAQVAWLALECHPTGCRIVVLSPVAVHLELGPPPQETVLQASHPPAILKGPAMSSSQATACRCFCGPRKLGGTSAAHPLPQALLVLACLTIAGPQPAVYAPGEAGRRAMGQQGRPDPVAVESRLPVLLL